MLEPLPLQILETLITHVEVGVGIGIAVDEATGAVVGEYKEGEAVAVLEGDTGDVAVGRGRSQCHMYMFAHINAQLIHSPNTETVIVTCELVMLGVGLRSLTSKVYWLARQTYVPACSGIASETANIFSLY